MLRPGTCSAHGSQLAPQAEFFQHYGPKIGPSGPKLKFLDTFWTPMRPICLPFNPILHTSVGGAAVRF